MNLDIEEMTTLERIQAMEALWDSLSRDEDVMAPPDWHGEVLLARRQQADDDHARFVTLEQLRQLGRK